MLGGVGGGGGVNRLGGGGCQPLRTALHTISISKSLQSSLSWNRAERL